MKKLVTDFLKMAWKNKDDKEINSGVIVNISWPED